MMELIKNVKKIVNILVKFVIIKWGVKNVFIRKIELKMIVYVDVNLDFKKYIKRDVNLVVPWDISLQEINVNVIL